MSFRIQHYVFWFQIPIYYLLAVQKLYHKNQFCQDRKSLIQCETGFSPDLLSCIVL